VAAAIHDPLGDDTALALRGEGAWIETPGGRRADLQVAAPAPAGEMAGNVTWRFLPEPTRSIVCRNLPRLGGCWDYRCSAHEYRMVAAGHCHFLFFNRLYPWDHAPGWLLHREAGGYSARLDGSDYRPTRTDGGLICAPDRASWQNLRDMLLDETSGAPA
jgi:fructose-1,6-bisphosphatase/inositol monophosphatase family enzyme